MDQEHTRSDLPDAIPPEEHAADSRIDALAAVVLILLLVAAAVFWVSGQ